ncbi:hypothetical protein M8C21_026470 [Ambrosia artemisiifolia]|uniref:Uncharacterized protein n=1 Tax=Ambrosia artemisiifolia TaxID=4212 RepID=A0AAD5BL49_AMBAR|nr:hypothetical protein M8C21_026470 [Ambrosia artemisiifolia]
MRYEAKGAKIVQERRDYQVTTPDTHSILYFDAVMHRWKFLALIRGNERLNARLHFKEN